MNYSTFNHFRDGGCIVDDINCPLTTTISNEETFLTNSEAEIFNYTLECYPCEEC